MRRKKLVIRLGILFMVFSLALGVAGLCQASSAKAPATPGQVGIQAEQAAAHEAGHKPISNEKLWELVWRTLNFVILAVFLVIVLRKPIKSGLASRAQKIQDELADLEAKREEAKREYAALERRLSEAEKEREVIVAEFVAAGEREKDKIVASAHDMAARIKDQAQFTIEQETAQAKIELRREIAELSASLAEDLLKEKITADDQTRLVDEYLAKVQQEVQ